MKISAQATTMKDKAQNLENYQDSGAGHISVNREIETLYTDTK
jgi:hypothetical protein